MGIQPHVMGIGGTTRPGSTTEKALRFALRVCEEEGASIATFTGAELAERTDLAVRLVEEFRRADGIIVASPGYHGSVSGLVKNALDYVEDMRDDPHVYFTGRVVGCIATGAGWQGVVSTLEALRAITHALRGWPTPMGAAINATLPSFGPDGEPADERVRFQLTTVGQEVIQFCRWRLGSLAPNNV